MSFEASIRLPVVEAYMVQRHGSARALTPDEQDVIDRYAYDVFNYVVEHWPVDTGTSRDAMSYYVMNTPGSFGFVIENPMYYAKYVHEKGGSPEDPIWRRLIPAAYSMVKAQLMAELQVAIDRTEKRIDAEAIHAGVSRREATRRAHSQRAA